METKKVWSGTPPTNCEVCGCKLAETFVDGKTAFGPWATMCGTCHRDNGGKLGEGKGQKYTRQKGEWVKTEG